MTNAPLSVLLDRMAVQDLLMRYFNAADRSDRKAVRSCFTQDVSAQYEGRPSVRGVDALMAQIALFDNLATGATTVATHFTGNLLFKELAGDYAETEHNVIACLVDRSGTTVAIRCLRYLDRLRREDGEWRIFARVHTLDWSCDLPCAFARPFGQKVDGFPADWPTR